MGKQQTRGVFVGLNQCLLCLWTIREEKWERLGVVSFLFLIKMQQLFVKVYMKYYFFLTSYIMHVSALIVHVLFMHIFTKTCVFLIFYQSVLTSSTSETTSNFGTLTRHNLATLLLNYFEEVI